MTEYVVLDVFTDRVFGGNPLAVFPDASGLPEDALQKIAREFNFSETTFVYPAEDPGTTARVRIFTPTGEIPFAGHPTIGTAIALAGLGHGPDMTFELGVGPIPVRATDNHAEFTTRHPLSRDEGPDSSLVAACVGLAPGDLSGPPVVASVGLPFILAEVASRDALARAAPAGDRFRQLRAAAAGDAITAIYLFVRGGNDVSARMFAPLDGVAEDPATGSAAAALAAHLADLEGGVIDLIVSQGVEMGRPSLIDVAVRGPAVTVAGRAVEVMRGTLILSLP